ncbi:MAG TPA: hypothetical protein VH417_03200 [Vicinamibacterales bacterium]
MNCYTHPQTAAVGLCALCQKAVCRGCVGVDSPRLLCGSCVERRARLGFEYRSAVSVGEWPLIHVCLGVDPVTMRPRVAQGVIAIGNIAVGGVAIAGLAVGLVTVGGLSAGLLFALGGVALGFGVSLGGVAIGGVAVGGVAIGYMYAIGGAAFAPAVVDGRRCDPAAIDFARRWIASQWMPPNCR